MLYKSGVRENSLGSQRIHNSCDGHAFGLDLFPAFEDSSGVSPLTVLYQSH